MSHTHLHAEGGHAQQGCAAIGGQGQPAPVGYTPAAAEWNKQYKQVIMAFAEEVICGIASSLQNHHSLHFPGFN